MNERIKELAEQAKKRPMGNSWTYCTPEEFEEQFAKLIVKEHVKLLQQEWYALNNAPEVENETPRDIGIRVGRKGEIISLIHKIQKHFGVE